MTTHSPELFTNPQDYLERTPVTRSPSGLSHIQRGLRNSVGSLRFHALHFSGFEGEATPSHLDPNTHRDASSSSISPSPHFHTPCQNVVLFGATGCGKSSIINMLDNAHGTHAAKAIVKNSSTTATTTSRSYDKRINDRIFRVFDTPGVNEGGEDASISTETVISGFHGLLTQLTDGIHLAVLVMKGGRILRMDESCYKLLRYLCGTEVPIVLVFTHLEQEEEMDEWWDNQDKDVHDLFPNAVDHACVTATLGKDCAYEDEYAQSKTAIETLLTNNARDASKGHRVHHYDDAVHYIDDLRMTYLGPRHRDFRDELAKFLRVSFGFDVHVANTIAYGVMPHG